LESSGAKRFRRSIHNQRNEVDTRRIYKEGVLKSGMMLDVRGAPVVIPGDDKFSMDFHSEVTMFVLAAATLIEAVYDAHSEDPDNEQARTSCSCSVA
jgi:hypothetical protein